MPILCFILGGLLVPRMVLAKGLIQVPPPRPAAAPAPTQEEIEQREQADKKEREDACRTEEKQVTDICADASTAIMNANKQADLSSQRLDEISHLFDQKLNAVLEKMTHSGRSCEGMNDLVKGGEEVKEQSLKKMEEIDGSNKLTERLFGKAYEKTLQCEDQKKVCASTCSEFPNLKVICSPPEKYEEKIGAITEKIATNKSKADVARVKSKEVPAKIQAHVESSRSGKGECSAAERRMQKVEDGFLAEKKGPDGVVSQEDYRNVLEGVRKAEKEAADGNWLFAPSEEEVREIARGKIAENARASENEERQRAALEGHAISKAAEARTIAQKEMAKADETRAKILADIEGTKAAEKAEKEKAIADQQWREASMGCKYIRHFLGSECAAAEAKADKRSQGISHLGHPSTKGMPESEEGRKIRESAEAMQKYYKEGDKRYATCAPGGADENTWGCTYFRYLGGTGAGKKIADTLGKDVAQEMNYKLGVHDIPQGSPNIPVVEATRAKELAAKSDPFKSMNGYLGVPGEAPKGGGFTTEQGSGRYNLESRAGKEIRESAETAKEYYQTYQENGDVRYRDCAPGGSKVSTPECRTFNTTWRGTGVGSFVKSYVPGGTWIMKKFDESAPNSWQPSSASSKVAGGSATLDLGSGEYASGGSNPSNGAPPRKAAGGLTGVPKPSSGAAPGAPSPATGRNSSNSDSPTKKSADAANGKGPGSGAGSAAPPGAGGQQPPNSVKPQIAEIPPPLPPVAVAPTVRDSGTAFSGNEDPSDVSAAKGAKDQELAEYHRGLNELDRATRPAGGGKYSGGQSAPTVPSGGSRKAADNPSLAPKQVAALSPGARGFMRGGASGATNAPSQSGSKSPAKGQKVASAAPSYRVPSFGTMTSGFTRFLRPGMVAYGGNLKAVQGHPEIAGKFEDLFGNASRAYISNGPTLSIMSRIGALTRGY